MLLCSGCNKVIANVDPVNTNYGICASCPTPEVESGDISVETALEVEQVARWIHSESDEPISEIEDLLLKMSTKDFYDEYEVVLETLKEREI